MPHRQAILYEAGGLSAALTHYAAGDAMPPHAHDHHQLSWLLLGEMEEETAGRTRSLSRPAFALKPADLRHGDRYGPHGALILSLRLDDRAARDWLPGDVEPAVWSPVRGAGIAALLPLLQDRRTAPAALADLLALAGQGEAAETGRGPAWLARARDGLRETGAGDAVGQLAAEAGVHRVHFSRLFTRRYGLPPSLYRTRCRIADGVRHILAGQSAAGAAAEAGFADQAHFARWVRREAGLTPRSLQRLLAAA